jgi:DNA-binding NarL/FixJ family response regulator
MDLTIPAGMGGKEAAQLLLRQDPDARLIVASGYSNDPVMADFLAYGFRAAISKPCDLAGMAGAIAQAMQP